ncbi:procathepsin L-like [Cydia pomonella]|uniref:procathepsin L-like n=1 Tax=Cydia pomonella TaxID=82600 RepID=UPI002ADDB438|nr:procathepsin L-like [Cydia pomonella]
MFVQIALAMVCLASSTVLAAYDKPFYDLEDAENLFKEFVQEHEKVYNRREYYERLEIFKATLKDINEQNAMFPDTVFALNHFADLKPEELEHYFGFKPSNETTQKVNTPNGPRPLPINFDWRTRNAVSHVKNQGYCGSAYIFSAIGNIEGQYAIKHRQCLSLSEGQVLDCLDSGGCDGGWPDVVMRDLYKKKLEKEEDYPYYPEKKMCIEDAKKGIAEVTGVIVRPFIKHEYDLMNDLIQCGPLSVAVKPADFRSYKGGIIKPNKCKGEKIYTPVLLVGYGEEKGKKFWIIKHSWGENYGEGGYSRLLREGNSCGIFDYVYTTAVY